MIPNETSPKSLQPAPTALNDLRFFLKLSKGYGRWMAGGAALGAATLLAGMGLLGVAGWFLTASAIAGAAAGAAGAVTFNFFFPSAGVRGFAMARTGLRYAERLVTHEATFRVLARIRLWVFAQAAPLAPGRLGGVRSGDLLTRVTGDVDALDNLYLRVFTPVIAALAGLILAVVVLVFISWPAALATGIAFVFAAALIPLRAARQAAGPAAAAADAEADARAEASDLVEGLTDVLAYDASGRMADRLAAATQRQHAGERAAAMRGALANAIMTGLSGAGAACAFLIAAATGASAPLAATAAFLTFALFEAAPPLAQAAELFGKTARSARRLRDLADMAPTARDPGAAAGPMPSGYDLAFEGVGLTYPGAGAAALTNIAFEAPEGARIGLVGRSGSGKSSLFNLILRFYDPAGGRVILGGADVLTLRAAAVRARCAYLGQRSELIAATVADNLRLGAPQADDAALWTALKRAEADGVVEALPDGLETWLGDDGQLLSGGQARRIALARAILKDAPILLLDEPTEGLDPATETAIIRSLTRWTADAGKTVIAATHRPAVLALTDTVCVLEGGRIIDHGPPSAMTGKHDWSVSVKPGGA